MKLVEFSILACLIASIPLSGQQVQRTGNGPMPAPGTCPVGAVCRTSAGTTMGPNSGSPTSNADQLSDPMEQKIWATAKQLDLSSDQRAQLKESLRSENGQDGDIDKAVQDAKNALANALANGETFLDSEIEGLAAANAKAQEHELKLWAKLYAVLTPDQQRRLLTMATPLSIAAESHQLAQN